MNLARSERGVPAYECQCHDGYFKLQGSVKCTERCEACPMNGQFKHSCGNDSPGSCESCSNRPAIGNYYYTSNGGFENNCDYAACDSSLCREGYELIGCPGDRFVSPGTCKPLNCSSEPVISGPGVDHIECESTERPLPHGTSCSFSCKQGYRVLNNVDTFTCSLGSFQTDSLGCEEIDECASNPCQNGGT